MRANPFTRSGALRQLLPSVAMHADAPAVTGTPFKEWDPMWLHTTFNGAKNARTDATYLDAGVALIQLFSDIIWRCVIGRPPDPRPHG